MAGYTFKQVTIQNFKYIPDDSPVTINLENKNIVILNGQNGYGKTTLFDALELLLFGYIKHFNANLLNRGTESLGVLANTNKKDIVISALLCSPNNNDINIKRQFSSKENFTSTLTCNEEVLLQDEFDARLKTSSTMFDIGTYISQSDSLNFLQNKYKSRKEQVSSLLNNPEITQKIELLRKVKEEIKNRIDENLRSFERSNENTIEAVSDLESKIEIIESAYSLQGENIRLFPSKEYPFDLLNFTDNVEYEEYVLPLKELESFVKNYEEYIKQIQNSYIIKLLEISKEPDTYRALFYSKQIAFLKENRNLIKTLLKCKVLLEEFKQHELSLDSETFKAIGISDELIIEIEQLMEVKDKEKKKLKESDQVLLQLTKARTSLVEVFNKALQQSSIEKDICPLCGTQFTDISKAFTDAERMFSEMQEDGLQQVEDIEKSLRKIFTTEIIPTMENFLLKEHSLIEMDHYLSGCVSLSTVELTELMKKIEINSFSSFSDDNIFDITEFNFAFDNLQNELEQKNRPHSVIISEANMTLYTNIHHTYYDDKRPNHTLQEFESKRQYIARSFMNNVSVKLTEARKRQKDCSDSLQKYKTKTDSLIETMDSLLKKYTDSYKDYQTLLANAIKLPLMIYSGKIIQNYPLGLGITAVVKENQLIFVAASKNDMDVYNILSTGQLNGLAIAILLSVKNVYGKPDGLDILLIDDPLQTIDDISAISFADLLCQQNIGQIILSTHEEQKARLLSFKFNQAHLSVCEKNMQQEYLNLKSKK